MRTNRGRIHTMQACPRRYYYEYVLNLVKVQPATPLRYGAAAHKFWELWHRPSKPGESDLSPADRQAKAIEGMVEDFRRTLHQVAKIPLGMEAESQLVAQCERLCRAYIQRYGAQESTYKIIETEISGEAPLPNGHTLVFRLDGLASYHDRLWIWENKTTARMGDTFLEAFMLDHQLIIYSYGTSVILGSPIAGVVLNIARKEGTNISIDFWREVIPYTREQVEDAIYTFAYVATDIEQRDKSNPKEWPLFTRACRTGGYLCPFWDICAHGVPAEEGPIYIKRPADYVDDKRLLTDLVNRTDLDQQLEPV